MRLPAILSRHLSAVLLDRAGGHRGHVLRAYAAKSEAGRVSRAELDLRQAAALAELLTHAVHTVPHWRDTIGPRTIRPADALAVLGAWPVMRRADLQAHPERYRAEDAGPVWPDATGGSTGTPMAFVVDRATQIARESSLMWADHLTGWGPGDRIAMLWGADRDVQVAQRSWRGALRLLVENRRWYNAFDMGPAQMERYHLAMTAFRPHLLLAYAGSLDVYARWLEETGRVPAYPASAIVSSAEMLLPEVRARVERVFRRPVFDRYGNREAGALAAECRCHQGLHVNEADCLLEVQSERPQEQPGPLLITYFANRAMPFIRYDSGDLGLLAPPGRCACGAETVRLARIAGRQSDTIRTRAGRWIHGEYFTHLLYGADAVRAFQFVQESLDDYCLRIEGDTATCRGHEAGWIERIRAEVGAGARVRVEYVDRIPTTASGKRKFTLSLLERP